MNISTILQPPSLILIIFTAIVLIKSTAIILLEAIRKKQLAKLKAKEQNKKAAKYQTAQSTLTQFSQLYKSLILLALLFSGTLGFLYETATAAISSIPAAPTAMESFLIDVVCVCAGIFLLEVMLLPISLYYSFVLEERFGFNTLTWKLWFLDTIKKIIITAVFFFLIFTPIYMLFTQNKEYWWIGASGTYILFIFITQLVVPKYIYPMFNKLTPIENDALKKELYDLAEKTNFNIRKIYISDGSKRSRHQNAFFAGIGKSRMIVLFDTLVQALTIEEIKAVLAHEIGHAKLGHIKKNIIFSLILVPIGFYVLHLITQSAALQQVFGFSTPGLAGGLLIFYFYSSSISFWLRPLANLRSWKYEYEADAYSKKQLGSEKPILAALKKLHKENLSLSPKSKVYKIFYQSHPTLKERSAALSTN